MEQFEQLYNRQLEFEDLVIGKSKDWPDKKLHDFNEKEKVAFSKELVLYLHQELSELIDAIGNYKMHKTKQDNPDTKEILEELADCCIFLIDIGLTHKFTAQQILAAIQQKQEKNFKRQKDGY